jgi:chromosome segregation ATPase
VSTLYATQADVAAIDARLTACETQLQALAQLVQKEKQTMGAYASALSALQQQVASEVTVEQSAVTLIDGIAVQLQNAQQVLASQGADTTTLQNLTTQIQASSQALAAAVAANTPASTSGAGTSSSATGGSNSGGSTSTTAPPSS